MADALALVAPACLPHIPHKSWADHAELQNYEEIERWARALHDGWVNGTVQPGRVSIPLHLPAKLWAGNRYELENYLAIERWAEHFQRECLMRAGLGLECADDDFARPNGSLGPLWGNTAIHKPPNTHVPMVIVSGAATAPEDTTGTVWSEVRYLALTTDPNQPSFIEAILKRPFAATSSPNPVSTTYELFLDLADNGSCEALTLNFVTVPPVAGLTDQDGALNIQLASYRSDGTTSVIATRTMSFPDYTSPVTIGFQSYGDGSYRGLLDGIEIISGIQAVDRAFGTSVGLGLNWTTTPDTIFPPSIDAVSMCRHAGTARGNLFFTDDCENFTDGPWTVTGTAAIGTPPTSPGRTGNCFVLTPGITNTVSYDIPPANQTNRLTLGAWIYFPAASLPTTVVPLISFRSDAGATEHLRMYFDSAGFLGVRQGTGTTGLFLERVIGPGLFTLNTWHHFEYTAHLDDARGSVTIQIDGAEIFTTTNQDTQVGGTKTVFDQIRFNGPNTSTGYRVDDIYLRDDNLLS
jgi:hypothetical protein